MQQNLKSNFSPGRSRAGPFAVAAIVVAMLASGLVPSAAAEVGSPNVPDVVYDAAAREFTVGGVLAFEDTRDLQVVNLATEAGVLWLCDSAVAAYKSSVVDRNRQSVTFTSVTFENAGAWTVREQCAADKPALATFDIESRDHYDVLVSFPKRYSNVITYDEGSEYLTLRVVDRENGRAAVDGADIVLYKGTSAERIVTTDANGFWDTQEPLPGAGTFTVEAYKDTAGDPSYEVFGHTAITISPRGLVVTRNTDAPLVGYTTPVGFEVATSTTGDSFLTDDVVASYVVTLTHPDGTKSTLEGTGAGASGPLQVTEDGDVVVTTSWKSGPYVLHLEADAAGTVTEEPEWSQTWLVSADRAARHDLVATVSPDRVLAGAPVDLDIKVTKDGTPFAADVYLLTAREAMEVHAGTLSPDGIPASRIIRADQATKTGEYVLSAALAGADGPFVVHAREPGTPRHDNAGTEPVIIVDRAQVQFSPARIAFGLQRDVPVDITVTSSTGAPLTGTLTVATAASTGAATLNGSQAFVHVVDGHASVVVDPVSKGRLLWDFQVQGSPLDAQRAEGVVFIERPNIEMTPRAVRLGGDTPIRITISDLDGNPLTGLSTELCGTPFAGCSPTAVTDATGLATIHGAPIVAGTLTLMVNGVDTGETVEASTSVSPNIVLGEPVLETARIKANEAFTVRVPVTNRGDATGLATLALNVDGSQAAQQTVEVPPGETKNVILSAVVDKAGTYSVSVTAGTATKGGLSVTALAGSVAEEPSFPVPGFEAVVTLSAVALAIGLYAVGRREF